MKNKPQKFALLAAALTVSMSLIACSETRTNVQAEKDSDKPTIAKKTETIPVSSPAAVAIETADKIGVAECDEYIQKYEACITSNVPQAQRAMLQTSFDQSRAAWKQAAAATQGKASLAAMCKQATDIAKQSTAAFNCAW